MAGSVLGCMNKLVAVFLLEESNSSVSLIVKSACQMLSLGFKTHVEYESESESESLKCECQMSDAFTQIQDTCRVVVLVSL